LRRGSTRRRRLRPGRIKRTARPRHNNRDRLPKGLRNKAWKDPVAAAEKFGAEEHAVDSACDFAWSDPRVRSLLREWLAGPERYISFEIETHSGLTIHAIFERSGRLVGDRALAVAIDPLFPKTVYCGLEIPCYAATGPSMIAASAVM
jgi:hypothetical protein